MGIRYKEFEVKKDKCKDEATEILVIKPTLLKRIFGGDILIIPKNLRKDGRNRHYVIVHPLMRIKRMFKTKKPLT